MRTNKCAELYGMVRVSVFGYYMYLLLSLPCFRQYYTLFRNLRLENNQLKIYRFIRFCVYDDAHVPSADEATLSHLYDDS